jgi:4-amino-4-deoxy-L-arabinose transferase-like glycosyltransferase
MLILLPIAAFTLFLLVIWTSPSNEAAPDWRKAFLQAAVLWGVVLVAITEGLSLGHALTAGWVAACWAVAAVAAAVWAMRSGGIKRRWHHIRWTRPHLDRMSGGILAAMAVIVACLLVVAWVAPPNNTDSLQYHMSRVVHWAQDRSLQHYATAYDPQIYQPVWAESAILNLRILWGDDKPANLVQWFSMVGALIGVSALAKRLGASLRGQLAATAFALSVPIAILESTSTQNDSVAAFWLVCLAYFVVHAIQEDSSFPVVLSTAGALGLGLLTKGTFYPYATPFIAWYIAHGLLRRQWRQLARGLALLALVVALLNGAYWARNVQTYGGPLGSTQNFEEQTGIGRSPGTMAVALVSNVALNFGLPGSVLNAQIVDGVNTLAQWLHAESEGFRLASVWNFEDLAGNPVHVLLVPASLLVLWIRRRQNLGQIVSWYALVAVVSFATMAVVVHSDPWGVRFQTPFFIVWAPVLGVSASALGRRTAAAVAILLVLASLPWVLFNRTRPMIGWRPRTSTDSIFRTPATESLFANWIERRDPSIAAAQVVEATGCRQIGLRLDSHDWEYSFWWLLKAPQSGIHIEVLNPPPHLARYSDAAYHPCAVICTICGSRARIYGLDLKVAFSDVRVYVGDAFVPDEGE